ncbi:MAG: iron-containing alcohol dehydrogenase [Alicyclobacillus macrosporangiidus]|uniref:iron-containing alcohol dehydrogenase n=1 Tax=Alicyclobacillus macrosporangiidus TaxID=392015 RepID=UPI0026F14847|nr:iron-containing alcohol dehydrogenase [Alicyclobacillus macrosporangiidus]MCL6598411.1 iron-containing alcohol dehydrogenase [Alicyclobacillus macrosporangiidus]
MPYVTSLFQFSVRTSVTSGAGSRALLPETVRGLGGRRAVLFTDKGVTNAGITEKVAELFRVMPGPVQLVGIFDEIEQDAKASIINRAARFYKECAGDSLVALGGGSVLDTVKGVKWMLHKGLTDIRKGLTGNVIETWPKAQYIPIPHVALPTTAGTGAEVSPIAVVFHDELQVKVNLIHPFVNADVALLDPELTVGLPPRVTAFTGFDALTHAIEGYFSPQANPMTDAYALHAVRLILENLPTAVHRGEDLSARANMLVASTLAITAFSMALNAIPVHNMAHAFGARFGIPHGLANAVLLPNVMAALPPFYLPRIQSFARDAGFTEVPADAEGCLAHVIERICALREAVGLPETFAEFHIPAEALAHIVDLVHADPAGVTFRLPDAVITRVGREVVPAEVE